MFILKFTLFKSYTAIWNSISPLIKDRDILRTQTIGYWPLERGDIIIFIPEWKSEMNYKRIFWLPWETVKIQSGKVEICKDNQCTILNEDYLPSWTITDVIAWSTEFTLTNGYFLLWDNRSWSTDSRYCFWLGCSSENSIYEIMEDNIIGEVVRINKQIIQ